MPCRSLKLILPVLLTLTPSVNLSVDTFPVYGDGFLLESLLYFPI